MKTLKEVKAEKAARRQSANDRNRTLRESFLRRADEWRVPDGLPEDTRRGGGIRAEKKRRARKLFAAGRIHQIDIACDDCGFELVGELGFNLMSYPACRWVYCLACGFLTTEHEF